MENAVFPAHSPPAGGEAQMPSLKGSGFQGATCRLGSRREMPRFRSPMLTLPRASRAQARYMPCLGCTFISWFSLEKAAPNICTGPCSSCMIPCSLLVPEKMKDAILRVFSRPWHSES